METNGHVIRRTLISSFALSTAVVIGGCGEAESPPAASVPPSTVTVTSTAKALPGDHPCEYLSESDLSALMNVEMTGTVAHPDATGTDDPVCAYMNILTGNVVTVQDLSTSRDFADVCDPFPDATIEYRDGIVGCAFDNDAYLVSGDRSLILYIRYPDLNLDPPTCLGD